MKSQLRNNQRGSMIIEVVLAIIVVAAIGAAIYARQKAQTNSAATQPKTATKSEASTGKPNQDAVYNGWQTYSSSEEGLTFRYPADWKLKTEQVEFDAEHNLTDKATVTSPSGLTLSYWAAAGGLGGACETSQCPDVQTYRVEKLPHANGPTDLYYVEGSTKSNAVEDRYKGQYSPQFGLIGKTDISGIPAVGEALQIFPYFFIAPKKHHISTGFVMFSFYPYAAQDADLTRWHYATKDKLMEFYNTPDAKTAKLILQSVSY